MAGHAKPGEEMQADHIRARLGQNFAGQGGIQAA
jgi:hypothetical protein